MCKPGEDCGATTNNVAKVLNDKLAEIGTDHKVLAVPGQHALFKAVHDAYEMRRAGLKRRKASKSNTEMEFEFLLGAHAGLLAVSDGQFGLEPAIVELVANGVSLGDVVSGKPIEIDLPKEIAKKLRKLPGVSIKRTDGQPMPA